MGREGWNATSEPESSNHVSLGKAIADYGAQIQPGAIEVVSLAGDVANGQVVCRLSVSLAEGCQATNLPTLASGSSKTCAIMRRRRGTRWERYGQSRRSDLNPGSRRETCVEMMADSNILGHFGQQRYCAEPLTCVENRIDLIKPMKELQLHSRLASAEYQ